MKHGMRRRRFARPSWERHRESNKAARRLDEADYRERSGGKIKSKQQKVCQKIKKKNK